MQGAVIPTEYDEINLGPRAHGTAFYPHVDYILLAATWPAIELLQDDLCQRSKCDSYQRRFHCTRVLGSRSALFC